MLCLWGPGGRQTVFQQAAWQAGSLQETQSGAPQQRTVRIRFANSGGQRQLQTSGSVSGARAAGKPYSNKQPGRQGLCSHMAVTMGGGLGPSPHRHRGKRLHGSLPLPPARTPRHLSAGATRYRDMGTCRQGPRSSKARPIPTKTSSCRQTLCSVKFSVRWLGMSTDRARAEKMGLRDSCYCFIRHRFLCFGCEHVEMSNTEDLSRGHCISCHPPRAACECMREISPKTRNKLARPQMHCKLKTSRKGHYPAAP